MSCYHILSIGFLLQLVVSKGHMSVSISTRLLCCSHQHRSLPSACQQQAPQVIHIQACVQTMPSLLLVEHNMPAIVERRSCNMSLLAAAAAAAANADAVAYKHDTLAMLHNCK